MLARPLTLKQSDDTIRATAPPEARHEASAAEISVPITPVNAALAAALAMEAVALRVVDMPAGSSLLCLATRPLNPR